jgi:hypothetical protein
VVERLLKGRREVGLIAAIRRSCHRVDSSSCTTFVRVVVIEGVGAKQRTTDAIGLFTYA